MGLMLLLRHHARTGEAAALEMVETTLKKMVGGGIYDQLGGGLSRYSTDYQWLVPHFEKMLYDNAQLLRVYAQAYAAFGKPLYRYTATNIAHYLRTRMMAPRGALYTAEDAQVDGVEGAASS